MTKIEMFRYRLIALGCGGITVENTTGERYVFPCDEELQRQLAPLLYRELSVTVVIGALGERP